MKKKAPIKWRDAPDEEEYAAAERYLKLFFDARKARQYARKLERAEVEVYPAKDLLRASGISILTVQAYDWSKQAREIDMGEPLSPILLVRQNNGGPLIIADGFHRVCAVFAVNEQIVVPCKIA